MTGIKEALEYNNERISELGPRIDALLAERDAALERAEALETYLRRIIQAGVPTRWWRDNECNICGGKLGTRGYHDHYQTCTLLDANEYLSLGSPIPTEERTTSG